MWSAFGGEILVFVRKNKPTKLIDSQIKIEGFFIELNIRRKKWLLCCSYNSKYSQISHHLKEIGKYFDVLTSKSGNTILMGDFNAELAGTVVSDFCEIYNLKNIIREKTFFKNPNNPRPDRKVFKSLWLRQVYLAFTKCVLQ